MTTKHDPTLLLGFDSAAAAPLSSYDLLAIGPFVVAAVIVAGIRKFTKRSAGDDFRDGE